MSDHKACTGCSGPLTSRCTPESSPSNSFPVALSNTSIRMAAPHLANSLSPTRYFLLKFILQRLWLLCWHRAHCGSLQPRALANIGSKCNTGAQCMICCNVVNPTNYHSAAWQVSTCSSAHSAVQKLIRLIPHQPAARTGYICHPPRSANTLSVLTQLLVCVRRSCCLYSATYCGCWLMSAALATNCSAQLAVSLVQPHPPTLVGCIDFCYIISWRSLSGRGDVALTCSHV